MLFCDLPTKMSTRYSAESDISDILEVNEEEGLAHAQQIGILNKLSARTNQL